MPLFYTIVGITMALVGGGIVLTNLQLPMVTLAMPSVIFVGGILVMVAADILGVLEKNLLPAVESIEKEKRLARQFPREQERRET